MVVKSRSWKQKAEFKRNGSKKIILCFISFLSANFAILLPLLPQNAVSHAGVRLQAVVVDFFTATYYHLLPPNSQNHLFWGFNTAKMYAKEFQFSFLAN